MFAIVEIGYEYRITEISEIKIKKCSKFFFDKQIFMQKNDIF